MKNTSEELKWPSQLTLIRHAASAYQEIQKLKQNDSLYQEFKTEYTINAESAKTLQLAKEVQAKFSLKIGDYNTPLAPGADIQATATGKKLRQQTAILPDIIFVSPYIRTHLTLNALIKGWPELALIETYEEERIRERDHGVLLLYNDKRVFFALNPDQKQLYEYEGPYYYRYPQGENIPDIRERNRSWLGTIIREFAGKNILVVSHHETILSTIANIERLDANQYLQFNQKPINCGVTTYYGVKGAGRAQKGKLILDHYNQNYSS